jgi:hypothetical protein
LLVVGIIGVVHHIAAIGKLGQVIDLDLRENLCSPLLREWEVVHIQRIFCPDIAASDAIPTQGAEPLLHPDVVRLVGIAAEVDCDVDIGIACPASMRRFPVGFELAERWQVIAIGLDL